MTESNTCREGEREGEGGRGRGGEGGGERGGGDLAKFVVRFFVRH